MSDHAGVVIAAAATVGFIIGALFVLAVFTKSQFDVECSLRYEISATATDTLAVVREYPYCADRLGDTP